jgi:hypothetical protein
MKWSFNLRCIAFLASLFLSSNPIFSRDIFVDRSAIASGDGSASSPYTMIQEGIDVAFPNDTVIIRGGPAPYSENLYFPRSGVDGQPITIRSAAGDRVRIDHHRSISFNQHHIIIDGLTFDHLEQYSDAFIWSGSDCILRNCELRNGKSDGIDFSQFAARNRVEKCVIHDFKRLNPRGDSHGIVTTPPFYNLTVISNTIYDCSGDCLQTYIDDSATASSLSTSSNLVIVGNLLYSTLGVNCENALDLKDGSRIAIQNNEMYGFSANKAIVVQKYHKDIIFDGNKVHHSKQGIEFRGEPVGIVQTNVFISRNEFFHLVDYAIKFDGVHNGRAHNNTISFITNRAFRCEGANDTVGGVTGGSFHNNLSYKCGTSSSHSSGLFSATVSNNGWFQAPSGSTTSGFSNVTDVVGSDPLFFSTTDFHLQASSTCINKGIPLGYSYTGSAPDLGCHELGYADNEDGKVRVVAFDTAALEGTSDAGGFRITRVPSSTTDLVVKFSLSGQATMGSDYATTPLTAIIPAGQTETIVTIGTSSQNDTLAEGKESVILTLQNDSAYEIAPESQSAMIYIWDDETPSSSDISVIPWDAVASESGPDSGSFLIVRYPAQPGSLQVFFSLSGTAKPGSDYSAVSTNITLAAGEVSALVTINPIDESLAEGIEKVTLTILPSSGYQVGPSPTSELAIKDDDIALVSIVASDSHASENAGDTGTFTMSVPDKLTAPLTVHYSVSGTATSGSDYTALSGTAVIPAGSTYTQVTVSPIADASTESAETVKIQLSADPFYATSTPSFATVSIEAEDLPKVFLSYNPSDAPIMGEPDLNGALFFSRMSAPPTDLTVYYTVSGTASNGVDYVTLPGSVIIPAGKTFAAVPILVLDDTLIEGFETIVVDIAAHPTYEKSGYSQLISLDDDDDPMGNDSNSDGISDDWQILHFGSPSKISAAATADPDNDGFLNFQEYKTQTIPTDRSSRLTFYNQTVNTAGDCTVQWQSVPGLIYDVEWSPDMTNWNFGTSLQATSGTSSWIQTGVAASNARRFYRIKVP